MYRLLSVVFKEMENKEVWFNIEGVVNGNVTRFELVRLFPYIEQGSLTTKQFPYFFLFVFCECIRTKFDWFVSREMSHWCHTNMKVNKTKKTNIHDDPNGKWRLIDYQHFIVWTVGRSCYIDGTWAKAWKGRDENF